MHICIHFHIVIIIFVSSKKAPRLDDVPPASSEPAAGSPKGDTKEPEPPETAESLKEKGNQAVRAEKFTEAVLHYSFAIKMSPNDAILYSNRSLAFLKLHQLYYANEDAERAIQLRPDWAKVFNIIIVLYSNLGLT